MGWEVGSVCASRDLGNGVAQGVGVTRSRDLEVGGAKVWVHLGVAHSPIALTDCSKSLTHSLPGKSHQIEQTEPHLQLLGAPFFQRVIICQTHALN